MARFSGGYVFYTNSATTIGVTLPAGSNAWASISDVNKKENIVLVNSEDILNKIGTLPISSWNYKTQDKNNFRHYGPMAQDFYKAFGFDGIGKVGCDTLINSHDFTAITLIGVQALKNKNDLLQIEIEKLKKINDSLNSKIENLEIQNKELKSVNSSFDKRLKMIESSIFFK